MKLDFIQIVPSIPFILEGIIVTLKYLILSVIFGFILGVCACLMRVSNSCLLRRLATGYTSLFRGTPLLVQLMLVYYCTPQLTGYTISAFEAGVVAFSLNSGAYISEIIRAGIQAVDAGQFEAVASLGISYTDGMKDIILPQAFKNILPALINEMITLLKESSLISVIGEMDLLRRANMVAAEKYIFFEPLIFIALIYYILVLALSVLAQKVEVWMARSDRH
jgi:His/Glu/Gln/Arg/opine family amino acid ABC transporter permease subunit